MTQIHAEYRALDPELPSIAALAAAEVDGLMSNRSSSVYNLRRLSQLLARSFEQHDRTGPRHFLDPISANVVASTLRDASSARMNSYDELAETSLKLVDQMEHASEAGNEQLLADLKRFCLALSKHALASSANSHTPANISEYRR